jgi:hypothetical protein
LDQNLGCNIVPREIPLAFGRIRYKKGKIESFSQSKLETNKTDLKDKTENIKRLIKPRIAPIRLGDGVDSPKAYGLNLDTPKHESKGDD